MILQYWSNFNRREKSNKPTIISFYRLPIKRQGKFVSLGFDKKYIFPYDLRVIANDQTLELMKGLQKKKRIKITIASIFPEVEPFTNISKSTITLNGKRVLVVNSLETEVEIDQPALKTLIEYLEDK